VGGFEPEPHAPGELERLTESTDADVAGWWGASHAGGATGSFQQLDFDALASVGRSSRQRAHGVDDAAAPTDDPASVVGRAGDLDHQGAVVLLRTHFELLGLGHQVHEDVVDEIDDHLQAPFVGRLPQAQLSSKPAGCARRLRGDAQVLLWASCRLTYEERLLARTLGVSRPTFSSRRSAVSVGCAPCESQYCARSTSILSGSSVVSRGS